MIKWDTRFIDLAKHIAQWSKDPSTKVGAVIVNPNRIVVGMGYNGFPRKVDDDPERYNKREIKYQLVVHAEINAILNSSSSVQDCTIYTWPLHPCNECAKSIIQSGITRVVSLPPFEERWKSSYTIATTMFNEAGIIVDILRI